MLLVLGGTPLDEPGAVHGPAQERERSSNFMERHPGVFIFLVLLFILTIFIGRMLGILPSGGRRGGGSLAAADRRAAGN